MRDLSDQVKSLKIASKDRKRAEVQAIEEHDDIISGVHQALEYAGRNTHQMYQEAHYLISNGHLPDNQMGENIP